MIRAIETHYNGYRFRSRLEARWAVFFDAMHMDYCYEREGFDLDNKRYLPDFYFPDSKWFLEVKGDPLPDDLYTAAKLATASHRVVLLVSDLESRGVIVHRPPTETDGFMYIPARWAECPVCGGLALADYCGCERCQKLSTVLVSCMDCGTPGSNIRVKLGKTDPMNTPKIISAFTAALSARFEYGETPRGPRGKPRA